MKKNQFPTMHFLKIYLCSPMFICILSDQAIAQIKKVWALGDGEKVYRYDNTHPDKNGNYIWDGNIIRLKGLYNEVMAFQVIVEAGTDGAKGIELSVDSLIHQPSRKVIGGNDLKYGPSGTIEIFSEHYLHVIDSTHPNWYYGSPVARPKKMTGWIPDALIPADALPGKGGFPLDMAPLIKGDSVSGNATIQNQGFWIDIHLPRDQKNFPAGIYRSKIRVFQNRKIVSEIPLEVSLLPYYLSDENHQNVWLFSNDIEKYFPELSAKQVEQMIKFEAHRHRIDLAGGFEVNQSFFNQDNLEKYKSLLDGTAFTPSNGYHGNGEGVGEKIFPIGMYGSHVMGDTKAEVQQQSDLWVDWFRKNAPGKTFFWYIIDEPRDAVFPWLKERAEWIKRNPGPGKSLPIFTTASYQEALAGAIDIWAGFDGVELKDLPAARKNGGDHWFYNGNRPRYGSVILEGAAVDFRINSWILYKYGINTWFIWHGTNWQHNSQGPKKHMHQNIFKDPLTFINDDLDFGNGDGILFYPGRMPFHPEEDRGLNRILPSIRLKNIRRGQQDVEMMRMVEKKAGRAKVISIINKIVPKALSEVGMKEPVPWSERGDDFDQVRGELLKLL